MSFDLKLQNGDLVLNKDGSLATVSDNAKLQQDVLKILITPQGGNKMFSFYGSLVNSILVGNVFDMNFTKEAATEQIRNGIETLQMLQKTQSKNQFVSAGESIVSVKNVYLNVNPQDYRVVTIKIDILTGALTTLPINLTVRT